jgi:hypothetical protein
MLGPAVAVLLIDQVGVGWAFAFDAASFLASAVLLRGIKLTGEAEAATVTVGVASAAATPAAEAADSTEEGLGILEGWRQLRGLTWLWVIVLEFAILNGLAFGPFQVFGAALGHQTFGMGNWALVLSAQGFGAVVGGIVGLFWRPERPLLVGSAAVGTFAVPMILLGAEAPVVVIAATAMVAGAGIAFFDTVWSTTIQDHAPEDAMSRISAIDLAGSYALLPGGMLMAAFLLVLIGPSGGLFFSGAVVAVGTAMVLNVPSVRRLRSKPVDP